MLAMYLIINQRLNDYVVINSKDLLLTYNKLCANEHLPEINNGDMNELLDSFEYYNLISLKNQKKKPIKAHTQEITLRVTKDEIILALQNIELFKIYF